jgi:hypothetical protein
MRHGIPVLGRISALLAYGAVRPLAQAPPADVHGGAGTALRRSRRGRRWLWRWRIWLPAAMIPRRWPAGAVRALECW